MAPREPARTTLKVGILGVPVDLGQTRRGVDMGPTAIRIARLDERIRSLGHDVTDFGNIQGIDMSTAKVGDEKLRFLDEILAVTKGVADSFSGIAAQGYFPLALGGDQSVSIGTLAGLSDRGVKRGIVWIDAHGDFNTHDTTPSGNVHGMALAAILGYGHPKLADFRRPGPKALERNTVLIGCRDLDEGEAEALERSKVTVFTMKEVDAMGMKTVMEEAVQVASKGVREVHLSFDVDAIDPREAPGTGTPVVGGLTYREAQLAMETLYDSGIITSAEFVEVNPILDQANRTAELAVQLLLSLFGKRILRLKRT